MRARSMPKRREALRADAVQSPLGKIKQFASDTPPAPAAVWSLRKKAGYFLAGKQNLPIFAPHYGNAVHPHFQSLFHGVMVSTRVFGSLSPRSSRSGTTIPSPPEPRFSYFFSCEALFFSSVRPHLPIPVSRISFLLGLNALFTNSSCHSFALHYLKSYFCAEIQR